MKDYSNAFNNVELPTQASSGNNTPRESTIDWDAYGAKQLEVLGVDAEKGGVRSGVIGVITQAIELGLQDQDEQTIPLTDKDYSNHEWRLEKWEDSGLPKDETAKIETRWYAKKQQECLVYTPQPVKQFALVLDFPELIFPYSEFYEGSDDNPFRIIMGKEGFVPKGKADVAGTFNLIAKPFNLKHVNVNRGKDGASPYYALAKNSKINKIADYAGVLNDEGNFHAQDIGKLIGKPVMCDISVDIQRWEKDGEKRSKVVIDTNITSKLGPRDVPYYESDLEPTLKDDLFGFVLLNGDNEEHTLKTLNAALINTMKLSPEFTKSKLKGQLEKLGKLGEYSSGNGGGDQSSGDKKEESPAKQEVPAESKSVPENDIIFDEDIPF